MARRMCRSPRRSRTLASAREATSRNCTWATRPALVSRRASSPDSSGSRWGLVSFTITPQQESWWDDSANGWTQTEGTYSVYLGDSSDLSGLPLQGSYTMAATPAARQVVVTAPSTMTPGQAATVQVQLTAGGDETLPDAQLALQLPQGWTATPAGATDFTSVAPGAAPTATFQVTPPSYAPNVSAVVHATATMGALVREAGETVTVP
jgi:hypothetical protein